MTAHALARCFLCVSCGNYGERSRKEGEAEDETGFLELMPYCTKSKGCCFRLDYAKLPFPNVEYPGDAKYGAPSKRRWFWFIESKIPPSKKIYPFPWDVDPGSADYKPINE